MTTSLSEEELNRWAHYICGEPKWDGTVAALLWFRREVLEEPRWVANKSGDAVAYIVGDVVVGGVELETGMWVAFVWNGDSCPSFNTEAEARDWTEQAVTASPNSS